LFLLATPLSRLRELEWICLLHACWAKGVTVGRGILLEVYRDFSAFVVHAANVDDFGVVEELTSIKRKPQEAKLLETDRFEETGCIRGRLQENALLGFCEENERENADCRGNPDGFKAIKWLTGSRRWDHSFCVMFEDILSRSS